MLNRFDLEEEFEISTPQASYDIAYFMNAYPKAVKYDKSLKTYIYQGGDTGDIEDMIERLYWEFDAEKKIGSLSERDIFKKKMRHIVSLSSKSKGSQS